MDFLSPSNKFYLDLRVEGPIENDEPAAFKVNGYNSYVIREPSRKIPEKAIREFLAWKDTIRDTTLAGNNISTFDILFLRKLAVKHKLEAHFGHRTVDLHSLCYSCHLKNGIPVPLKDGRTNIDSDYIMCFVGLPEEPKPHKSGLVGAIYEAEAFSRLIYGKPLFQEFEEFKIPKHLL